MGNLFLLVRLFVVVWEVFLHETALALVVVLSLGVVDERDAELLLVEIDVYHHVSWLVFRSGVVCVSEILQK